MDEEYYRLLESPCALPQKFLVRYALACIQTFDPTLFEGPALKCITLVEKWLEDPKSISDRELLDSASFVNLYANTIIVSEHISQTVNASYAAGHAAYTAAHIIENPHLHARCAASRSRYNPGFCPSLLLKKMIKEEFSNTEMLLMGINHPLQD